MHIDVVPNRTSRPAYLQRETYREGGKVKKRTVANLSALSDDQIRMIRAALKGESLYPLETLFKVTESRGHGHVQAVQTALSKLGMTSLLASRASRECQRVLAMQTARILAALDGTTPRSLEAHVLEKMAQPVAAWRLEARPYFDEHGQGGRMQVRLRRHDQPCHLHPDVPVQQQQDAEPKGRNQQKAQEKVERMRAEHRRMRDIKCFSLHLSELVSSGGIVRGEVIF
jgi:hypothetical protein